MTTSPFTPCTRDRARTSSLAVATLVLALAVVSAGIRADSSPASPERIAAALRDGGHVVYFRHAATIRSGVDRIEGLALFASLRRGAIRITPRDPANGGSTQTTDPEPPR